MHIVIFYYYFTSTMQSSLSLLTLRISCCLFHTGTECLLLRKIVKARDIFLNLLFHVFINIQHTRVVCLCRGGLFWVSWLQWAKGRQFEKFMIEEMIILILSETHSESGEVVQMAAQGWRPKLDPQYHEKVGIIDIMLKFWGLILSTEETETGESRPGSSWIVSSRFRERPLFQKIR